MSKRLKVQGRGFRTWTAVVSIVAVAGAAAVVVWPHAWWWLVPLAAAMVAGMPVALSALTDALGWRAETATVARRALQGVRGGKLPLVKDTADLDARVHRAVAPIPYVQRDVEGEVCDHLRSGRPVLLVGSSMVGKTRMAVRLIREMFPDRGIVIPDSLDALASLDAANLALRERVIFLDDINRLIGTGGITDGALHQLIAAGNIVVGTIRAAEYDHYQPTDQLRPPEWDVVSVFERVVVSRELSAAEKDRLTTAVSDRELRQRIATTGLGEYVGGAVRIKEALEMGPSASPGGYALVQGVAAWRRAGMTRPVPSTVLPALAEAHLNARDRARFSDTPIFESALAWATRDINPTVSLLQQSHQDGFTIFDYALDIISREATPIPDTIWQTVIGNATPSELVTVGYTASGTFKLSSVAAQAWSKAADSDDADAAPMAAVRLGVQLAEQGDLEQASAELQRALDSGHVNAAPLAALSYGILLRQQGNIKSAQAAFQRAVDSGHVDATPMAAVDLGRLLRSQGNVDRARAMYQLAIDSGHAEAHPHAALGLGNLFNEQGDVEGAIAAWQKAVDSGHPDDAPAAMFNIALLLQLQGDLKSASAMYQRVIDSGHAKQTPKAAFGLMNVLLQQGDAASARTAYQKLVASGHADGAIRQRAAAEGLDDQIDRSGGS